MARIVFMGSPDFAVPSLRAVVEAGHEVAAVYTQPDREAGRGRALAPSPVKVAAEALGLTVVQPVSLRRAEAVAELRASKPEVIVVAAYGQILRPAVLAIPPFGTVNVHASLLPRWRGASPVTAAILAGDERTGVSIMLLDEGLDTGPVLTTRETPIGAGETGGTLTERLSEHGAALLVDTLPSWLEGTIVARPQDDAQATYAPRLSKEAGRIDWRTPAIAISRAVRAYTPWPGAFTAYKGAALKVLEADAVELAADGVPGDVVRLPSGAARATEVGRPSPVFGVVTGDGLLTPLRIQRAGKRAVTADEFIRGEPDLIGSRFGAVLS